MAVDTYSTAGTFTWTSPITGNVQAQAWGAGGGGGSRTLGAPAGGGGGGAYSVVNAVAVEEGLEYTVVVGAGGGAGVGGGDSSFVNSATLLAKGGLSGSVASVAGYAGGASASGVGDTKFSGGTGGNGSSGGGTGGGGGSSAGTAANGNNGVGRTAGTAPTGGGAGGIGGASAGDVDAPGNAPGGGGGGQGSEGTSSAGAAGKVVLTYTALAPVLAVTGTADNGTYGYGNVATNEATSHQFTITNTGDGSDTLGTLSISGDGWSIDAADDPSGDALAASGTTTVTVIGNFATAGAKAGILTIPSNDVSSPYVINLTALALAAGPHLGTMGLLGVGR